MGTPVAVSSFFYLRTRTTLSGLRLIYGNARIDAEDSQRATTFSEGKALCFYGIRLGTRIIACFAYAEGQIDETGVKTGLGF